MDGANEHLSFETHRWFLSQNRGLLCISSQSGTSAGRHCPAASPDCIALPLVGYADREQHATKRSEIELIDVLFIEYLWRPKKDLTPVDDLYLSKFPRLKLSRARF